MKRVSLALCSLVAALTLPAYAGSEHASRTKRLAPRSAAPRAVRASAEPSSHWSPRC